MARKPKPSSIASTAPAAAAAASGSPAQDAISSAARFSRSIEFAVDAGRGTATRVWEFRHSPEIYAALVGSTHRVPGGNTTVLFGMLAGHNQSTGPLTAVEVTPSGAVAWRLRFGSAFTRVYRLTPVESLVGERPGAFR